MAPRTSNRRSRGGARSKIEVDRSDKRRSGARRQQTIKTPSSSSSASRTQTATDASATAETAHVLTKESTVTSAIDQCTNIVHQTEANTNHPQDCDCYLRRLNKSLFLPPSLMMDEMDKEDRGKR